MNKEIKRAHCLSSIYQIVNRNNPNLINCGRYIKALRQEQNLTLDIETKQKYEYIITKLLEKHIIYLQEAILSATTRKTRAISPQLASKIKSLSSSQYSVQDQKYSLVDIDGLRKMEIIKKAVILKDDLVLPCKVKSDNQQFKFNTQIIVTKDNVLTYASCKLEHDPTQTNINHNTLLTKIGKGILENELISKQVHLTK